MGKIIIPGEPEPKEPTMVAWPMFVRELEKVWENNLAFDRMMKIQELRKSCGVESSTGTVNIRRPPRYFP